MNYGCKKRFPDKRSSTNGSGPSKPFRPTCSPIVFCRIVKNVSTLVIIISFFPHPVTLMHLGNVGEVDVTVTETEIARKVAEDLDLSTIGFLTRTGPCKNKQSNKDCFKILQWWDPNSSEKQIILHQSKIIQNMGDLDPFELIQELNLLNPDHATVLANQVTPAASIPEDLPERTTLESSIESISSTEYPILALSMSQTQLPVENPLFHFPLHLSTSPIINSKANKTLMKQSPKMESAEKSRAVGSPDNNKRAIVPATSGTERVSELSDSGINDNITPENLSKSNNKSLSFPIHSAIKQNI